MTLKDEIHQHPRPLLGYMIPVEYRLKQMDGKPTIHFSPQSKGLSHWTALAVYYLTGKK